MKSFTLLIALIAASQYSMAYCTNNLGGGGNDNPLDSVSIQGTTLAWPNPDNTQYYFTTPGTGNSTATLVQGQTYTFVLYSNTGNLDIASFWIDYDQSNSFDPSEWTQICTAQNGIITVSFTVPIGAALGTTGMRVRTRNQGNDNGAIDACTTFGSGETGDFTVSIIAATPCAGQPVAGAVNASATSDCAAYTSLLSLPGATQASGLTYQWQSSANGTNWTNVNGATNPTYLANVAGNIYYRAYLTCTASNLSDTATSVNLLYTGAPVTYATLPYFEGFENWGPSCYSFDRPDQSITLSPVYGDESWRRDDQGDDAGWDDPNEASYFPASNEAAHSARFHSYDVYGGQGSMDVHLDLSAAGTKQITFDYINGDDYQDLVYLTVLLSTDGGATFNQLAQYAGNVDSWVPELLITTATASQCILRFQGSSEGAYPTDMGIDSLNVTLLPSCSGAPVAGAIQQSQATSCSAYNNTINAVTPIYLSGIAYQWQSSSDNINWSNVFGATSSTYIPFVTANTYFRFYVVCTNSNLADTSVSVFSSIVTPVATYATLPFFEGFENWTGTCFNFDRPSLNWLTNPASGDNSWRRDDQGDDAAWDFPNQDGVYSPASNEGDHSARFHSADVYGDQGSMDLYVDLSAPGTKKINFDVFNGDDYQDYVYLTVFLSTDGGNTFIQLAQYAGNIDEWTPELLTTSTTSSQCVLRFQGSSDGAYPYDIGVDSLSITVLPACTGTPVAGTIQATTTTGCSAYTSYLSFTAPTFGTGITYQWQSSVNGTNWTNIAGATNYLDTIYVTAPVYVRAYVRCTNSNGSDTTAGILLNLVPEVVGTASLPYFQGFENWTGTCYNYDRPDTNWLNSPTYGDDSWRRDDQGDDAAWDDPFDGGYYPVSSEANHSARFHSYEAEDGTIGDFDLHIDLSAGGTKNIDFDYNNDDGYDYLTIELSEDGGNTFTILGTLYSTDYLAWTPQSFPTTSTASNAIIRFEAMSDFGGTDIGIDSLNVYSTAPCTAPTNLAVAPVFATSAVVTWTAVPGATGYEYTIDQLAADPLVPGTPTTNNYAIATGLTPVTGYYAHVRTDCAGGNTSSWVTAPFTTTDTCAPPANIAAANITTTSATFSWNAVPGALGYRYVLDQSAAAPTVAGTFTAATTYAATNLFPNAAYYFHVKTECSNTDSSTWAAIPLTLLPSGVAIVTGNDFSITASPNPATGIVNVTVNGVPADNPALTVTDVVGKIVMLPVTVDSKKTQIDMAQLAPGTYFINYNDSQRKQTIKVNKE